MFHHYYLLLGKSRLKWKENFFFFLVKYLSINFVFFFFFSMFSANNNKSYILFLLLFFKFILIFYVLTLTPSIRFKYLPTIFMFYFPSSFFLQFSQFAKMVKFSQIFFFTILYINSLVNFFILIHNSVSVRVCAIKNISKNSLRQRNSSRDSLHTTHCPRFNTLELGIHSCLQKWVTS